MRHRIIWIYRLLLWVLFPIAGVWLMSLWLRGRDRLPDTANRLGFFRMPRPQGRLLWIHAASVGELTSVRAMLRHFNQTQPDLTLLITVNNPVAARLARHWDEIEAIFISAPIDYTGALRRFLGHWRPDAYANIEAEFWPNRFAMLARRQIPTLCVNARLSERSANRIAACGMGHAIFDGVAHIYCQNPETASRMMTLGVDAARVSHIGNLKSMVTEAVDADVLAELQAVLSHDKTILSASTHQGEEGFVLRALQQIHENHPDTRLVIAPRHPADRCDAIARQIREAGYHPILWPDQKVTDDPAHVVLVNSLGAMPLWYSVCGISFVGGSLVDRGGHTPFEPVHFGSAIVSGPHVANFESQYNALSTAGACHLVPTPEAMTLALIDLLNPDRRAKMAAEAQSVLPQIEQPEQLFDRFAAELGLAQ